MCRNSVLQTHPLEKQVLSSYPLKVAVMTQSSLYGQAMATQDSPGLYASTLNALKLLDPEAVPSADSGSKVPSSLMITGDLLFKEGETSYYEARRIAKKLKKTERLLSRHRSIHIFILCLQAVLTAAGFWVFEKSDGTLRLQRLPQCNQTRLLYYSKEMVCLQDHS